MSFNTSPHRRNRVYGAVSNNQINPPVAVNNGGGQQRKKRWRMPGWKKLLKAALVLAAAGFIILTGVIAWASKDLPDPNKLTSRNIAQSTKIYDRTGEHLLYEVFQDQKRTIINLDQMSPWLPKATIAIEDKYFYQHGGIRPLSILRAGFNNLIGRKAGSGGASTLTQQLIKKTIVGDERTIWRKIKEAIMAIRLEKKYSKDDILKMYLNEIPYGSTNYGVESASQSYFKKSAKDITLYEAATIAALTQAPSHYLNNPQELRARRDLVLRLMFDQGYISEKEKTEAQNQALRVYRSGSLKDAPHFVLYVKQLLDDELGEANVDTGGLKVITTLDYDKQKAAEKIVTEQGDKFAKTANANNASLVAMDPKTGQVLVMVGSRDYNNDEIDGQFNVAALGRLQPGSSIKPFIYTAAFEKGFTPDTVLYDVLTNFGEAGDGKNYSPKDYDEKERGLVTMRKALQGSLNIPAVKTLYLVGIQPALDYLKRFGYTSIKDASNYGLSLVLGGLEVSPLEHTAAYAALANNGVYHAPVSILKVTNSKGENLLEWKPDDGAEAVKPELSALISSVLTDDNARAFIFGAHGNLTLPDRKVAAKTGTTNENRDAWTMGYTPSFAAGVWVGNTKHTPMKFGGNTLAAVIFKQFMVAALKGALVEDFAAPPPNDATKPALRGNGGGITLPINKITGRIANSSTPVEQIENRTFLPPHDILQYVNKDDPRGPAPTDPASDPQYQNWEDGLQDWINRQQSAGINILLSEPPTEYDNGVSSDLRPSVQIISPTNNQEINSRQLNIQVKAAAPRGVFQVSYRLDGQSIGFSNKYPFDFNFNFIEEDTGQHTLEAIASDDVGNSASTQITFNLTVGPDYATVKWLDKGPLNLKVADYPRAFYLNVQKFGDVETLKIYLVTGSKEKLVYTFFGKEDVPQGGKLNFIWQKIPAEGNYTLRAEMVDNNGKITNKNLQVVVTK